MATNPKQPVSVRALVARINRRLANEGERVLTCREASRWFQDCGRYYVVNDRDNILATDIDLEAYGRETGALRAWEQLAADDEDGGR
jgi:hypothetical protein